MQEDSWNWLSSTEFQGESCVSPVGYLPGWIWTDVSYELYWRSNKLYLIRHRKDDLLLHLLLLHSLRVRFNESIRLTSYVLAQPCCDEATFTGCTSRSLLACSGLVPLRRPPCLLLISSAWLTQVSSTDVLARSACVQVHLRECVCARTPPASPQQDCQSVCDCTPTHLRLCRFLTDSSPFLASFFCPPFHRLKCPNQINEVHLPNDGVITSFSFSLSFALLRVAA